MNHLTNHYKHKCEQLQEQINNMKRFLREAQNPDGGLQQIDIPLPTDFDMFGPRNPNYGIPTGQPGNPNQGPSEPRPNGPPPQPLPGASETEWNQWLDRMWQWYITKYPYTLTGGNGDYIQQWWRVWHDIHELAPNYPFGWDWTNQPVTPNGPPIPAPIPPKPKPNNTPVEVDPADAEPEPWQGLPYTGPHYEPNPHDWKPKPKPRAPKPPAPRLPPPGPWWNPFSHQFPTYIPPQF